MLRKATGWALSHLADPLALYLEPGAAVTLELLLRPTMAERPCVQQCVRGKTMLTYGRGVIVWIVFAVEVSNYWNT